MEGVVQPYRYSHSGVPEEQFSAQAHIELSSQVQEQQFSSHPQRDADMTDANFVHDQPDERSENDTPASDPGAGLS